MKLKILKICSYQFISTLPDLNHEPEVIKNLSVSKLIELESSLIL